MPTEELDGANCAPDDLGAIAYAVGVTPTARPAPPWPRHAAAIGDRIAPAQPYALVGLAEAELGPEGLEVLYGVGQFLFHSGPEGASMDRQLMERARATGTPVTPMRPIIQSGEELVRVRELVAQRRDGDMGGVLRVVEGEAAVPPRLIGVSSLFAVARGDIRPPDGFDLAMATMADIGMAAHAMALSLKEQVLERVQRGEPPTAALRRTLASARRAAKWRLIAASDCHNSFTVTRRRGRCSYHDAQTIVAGAPDDATVAAGDAMSYFFCYPVRPSLIPYLGARVFGDDGKEDPTHVWLRTPMGADWAPDHAHLGSALAVYVTNLRVRRVAELQPVGTTRTRHMVDDYLTIGPGGSGDATNRAHDLHYDTMKVGGFGVAVDKHQPAAARGKRLGRDFDSSGGGTWQLPRETAYRYGVHLFLVRALLARPETRAACAGKTAEVLAGKLQWWAACSAMGSGRLGALYALASANAYHGGELAAKATSAAGDLDWWATRITHGAMPPLRALHPTTVVGYVAVSDASDYAVGGAVRPRNLPWSSGLAFYRRLDVIDAGAPIVAREMLGVELAVRLYFFAVSSRGEAPSRLVLLGSDNGAVAAALGSGRLKRDARGGSTGRDSLARTLQELEDRAVTALTTCLPREANRLADAISYSRTIAEAREAARRWGVGHVIDMTDGVGLGASAPS
ncbi:MAG: hypothetical protein WCK28_19085 [Burkholderiales bacterium]